MRSQKIIRCEIRRAGSAGPMTKRYVPLQIFGPWEYLMIHKHSFEVVNPTASLWLSMENSPETAYGNSQHDRVTQVTAFVFHERYEMFTRARRYFATEHCEEITRIFLSHYAGLGSSLKIRLRERPGFLRIPSIAIADSKASKSVLRAGS